MKLKYYFLSLVLATSCGFAFTSCDDDDEVVPVVEVPELTFDSDALRVKIGEENKAALPIATGGGQYNAFSLDESIAKATLGEDGIVYVEGLKNGNTYVVVSDAAGNYKRYPVSVYTTEAMTLSHENYSFVTPLGISSSSSECAVVLGNGGYTVETDNEKVRASINSETGVITMTATSGRDEYVAIVTVTDCSNLTASINVTVTPTFDAFTASEIEDIKAKTKNDYYIMSNQFTQNINYDLRYYGEQYHTWKDADNGDGTHTFGLWEGYGNGYYDYVGHYVIYPQGTAVDQEVAAKYEFKYNSGNYNPKYELDGTAKIIKDDATSKIVIWWNVDLENEVISRGWIVKMK